ncbi:MAG TPA: ABC transporter ATP-binding protein [Burkholderiales bacterium]|nr:ABC transporter ATP-binding protein [Burkholderiales bacterium]
MSVPVLRVSNLSVAYPAGAGWLRAIDDVSFDVAEGRALGVVGESGSGKSTSALAVLGLLAPEARVESGAAQFKGESLFDLPEAARRNLRGNRISIVFQDPFTSLNPALPVGHQIAEPLVWHKGMDAAAAATEVERLLAEVGIARPREVALAYPHQLSGGMKQRALIATALACSPELLILDEPTTALDVTIEAQILDLLESLRRSRGLSMLYITHNLGVVARICDDVCVLYAGRVVEQGATASVLEAPRHPYTKGLLASLPRVTERKHRLAPIAGRFPDLTAPPPGCIFHPRCSFVLDRCKTEPQVLADGVRCWRAAELAGERWRVDEDSIPARVGKGEGALVEVKDLAKTFQLGGMFDGFQVDFSGGFPLKFDPPKVRAVDGVSLSVSPGEVLGLVGESGCGKSTLGRMLVGLIEPSAGEIRIAGGSPQSQHRAAQIIFQNPDSSLNPRKTVQSIVGRPLELHDLASGPKVRERVVELLELVRLSAAYLGRYPHQLSGGEKQRVGIARALATSPRFIVCDEAVSALDVSVQAYVLNVLADLRDRLNVAYLFISHDLSVIAHIADRIAVMYRGAIVEDGRTEDVLQPPWHPYTEALLSAIPEVDRAPESKRIRLRGDAVERGEAVKGCRFQHRCPRKIGAICETDTPPVREAAAGHRIACHIEV